MPQPINEIRVRFIPHERQRYCTSGDWTIEGDTLFVLVSRTANPLHEQLVAIHEIAEAVLCTANGITPAMVDAFDITGPGKDMDDPGASATAPYHGEHMIATAIERVMASALGVDWSEYDAALSALT